MIPGVEKLRQVLPCNLDDSLVPKLRRPTSGVSKLLITLVVTDQYFIIFGWLSTCCNMPYQILRMRSEIKDDYKR